MKQLAVIVLTVLTLSSSCKKEKPTTTINGLTFGCKVNGKQFVPNKWDYGYNIAPININFSYDPLTKTIYLKTLAERENEFVEIFLNSPLVPGRRELKHTTVPYPTNANPQDYGLYKSDSEYITSEVSGGYVNLIEIDTTKNKVYATFEFTGTDRNSGKQIKITNGVFRNF